MVKEINFILKLEESFIHTFLQIKKLNSLTTFHFFTLSIRHGSLSSFQFVCQMKKLSMTLLPGRPAAAK